MRKNDVFIFGKRAWQLLDLRRANDALPHRALLRLLAGPEEEAPTQDVLASMLEGRPIYRQVSALDDVDLDAAVTESTGTVDVETLGNDPRRWTEAFQVVHGSRQTPDATIMLGWFAAAMEESRRLVPPRTIVRRPMTVKKAKPKKAAKKGRGK